MGKLKLGILESSLFAVVCGLCGRAYFNFRKDFRRTTWNFEKYIRLNGEDVLNTLYGHPDNLINITYKATVNKGPFTLKVYDDENCVIWERVLSDGDEDVIEIKPLRKTTYRLVVEGHMTNASLRYKTTGAGTISATYGFGNSITP
jgi:hypothetical protein